MEEVPLCIEQGFLRDVSWRGKYQSITLLHIVSQLVKHPIFFSNIFLSISDILSLIYAHNKNFNVEKLMNKKSIFLSLLPKKWFKEKKYLWIPSFIIFHIHISLYLWDIIQYVLKIKLFRFILYMYIPTSLNFNTEWSALCISFFFSFGKIFDRFWK